MYMNSLSFVLRASRSTKLGTLVEGQEAMEGQGGQEAPKARAKLRDSSRNLCRLYTLVGKRSVSWQISMRV